ncbi:hypothetical protein [Pseudomonas sp. Irchel 3H3]|uniref:hypothetical protein n=1 Tax=Pseudomonas sp. Irchel 3H3 TaxID=2009038 RepID=UPI002115201B|nr:hypothetical protein [Pseudomonas sp. Irchel 3H3]
MQEPANLPSFLIAPDSLFAPFKEAPGFALDLDSILLWDGVVPAVTPPYNIDDIKNTRDTYTKLVEVGLSVCDQIMSSFSGGTSSIINDLKERMSSAVDTQQPNTLEADLKKKAIIFELLQKIVRNRSWSAAVVYFGVDALSLNSTESSELFAAYVDAEDYEGASRSFYEGFLRSLTAAYVKRILVEAVVILEDASMVVDAAIHSALAKGDTAYTFRLPIVQSAQLGTVAGTITLHTANGWTLEAAIQKGIQLLSGLGEALLSRATAVGIGALFYSPALGNGERYPETVLSLPANKLLPGLPPNLN